MTKLKMGSTTTVVIHGNWLSLEETCTALGKSPKTIERWVAERRIQSELQARTGRKPERVYNASDVERIRALLQARQSPASAGSQPALQAVPKVPQSVSLAMPPEFLEFLRGMAPRPEPKPWLLLAEAHAAFNFSESYLKKLIEEKKVVACKGGPNGSWLIRRASLEAYEG